MRQRQTGNKHYGPEKQLQSVLKISLKHACSEPLPSHPAAYAAYGIRVDKHYLFWFIALLFFALLKLARAANRSVGPIKAFAKQLVSTNIGTGFFYFTNDITKWKF